MKKILYFLSIISFSLAPLFVNADGGLFIESRPDMYMDETAQQAVIFYEGGIETLILATTFKGNAADFGWVIPTPGRPKVTKASAEVFTKLEEITRDQYYRDNYLEMEPMDVGAYRADKSVTVIETKKIDYYHIDILEATDATALANWLKENNYHFPISEQYILNDYIENKWYFVAIKIDSTAQGSDRVNLALEAGRATPLKIVFPTDSIVYPMKISSIQPEPAAAVANEEIHFVDGIDSQAVYLPANTSLWATIQTVGTDSPLNDLQLSFAFKSDSPITDDYYQLVSVGYTIRVGFSSFGFKVLIGGQEFSTESGPMVKAALSSSWNQLRITARDGEVPHLNLNGQEFNLIDYQNPTQPKLVKNVVLRSNEQVIIGEHFNRVSNVGIAFDEIKLANYSSPALVLSIPFDFLPDSTMYMDTTYQEAEGHFLALLSPNRLAKPTIINNSTDTSNDYIPIELYVMADHRQELTNFNTPYAGWIRAKAIEDLGVDTNGAPLIAPDGKKYFLTKLTRSMQQSEMTDDLFPRPTDNDGLVGGHTIPWASSPGAVIWLVVISVIVSVGLIGVLIWWTIGKKQ